MCLVGTLGTVRPSKQECALMTGLTEPVPPTNHPTAELLCLTPPRNLLTMGLPAPHLPQALNEVVPSVAAEKVAAGGFWVLRPDSGAWAAGRVAECMGG